MLSVTKCLLSTVVVLTVQLPVGTPISSHASAEELDWWEIDNSVARQLVTEEKNLVDWASELLQSEPKTPRAAIINIDICMRAALDDEASDALQTLRRLNPDVSLHLLNGIYHQATDDHKAWDVARVLVETFAPQIHDFSLDNRLLQHYRAGDQPLWTDEQLIAWLDARVESVRAYDQAATDRKGPDDDGQWDTHFEPTRPIDFWRRLRLQQLAEMGRASAELKKLEAAVRVEPKNASLSIEYLKSLDTVRFIESQAMPKSLNWMAKVCRPAQATDQRTIASLLVGLQQPVPAEAFLRRAIETNVTADELMRLYGGDQGAGMPVERGRIFFAVTLLEELAACLLKLGKADESQAVMVKAAEMRQNNDLPLNLHLSGMVQAASGAHVIEGRIREQEPENRDDPKYWRKRATYFRGRGEVKEQESALRRGLELCKPAEPTRGKGKADMRRWLLGDLTRFLIQQDRHAEAVKLLLSEMKEAPADSASSEGAARSMAFDLAKYVNTNQDVLWGWLSRREEWGHTEERLLWRMLQAARPQSLDAHCTHAEQLALADDADASRAATLGWVLNRIKQTQRSVRSLVHAAKKTTDNDVRRKANFTLLESHLALKDWRKADAIFGLANARLTSSETPQWLGRIATIAAVQGDHEDAMRIWRRVANCSLRNRQLVEDLSKQGLRQPLLTYYATIQRRLPTAKLATIVE